MVAVLITNVTKDNEFYQTATANIAQHSRDNIQQIPSIALLKLVIIAQESLPLDSVKDAHRSN